MATSEHPVLPNDARITSDSGIGINPQSLGQAASERVRMRESRLIELELRGEIKPATILNRSPFELKVETGLWDYVCPSRQSGKPFSSMTITGTRTIYPFRGNQEMSDKSLRAR